MTPNELYARKNYVISNDLNWLSAGDGKHLPEVEGAEYGFEDQNEIVLRVYRDHWFDHRRCWRLASIWLGDRPIMIVRNAGREGDDHVSRFITNEAGYHDLIRAARKYLRIRPERSGNPSDVVAADQNIPDLTSFYGNSLDGEFEIFVRY